MNRLLVRRSECAPDGTVRIAGRRALHIRDVLHAAPGDEIRAGFLDEGGAVATVVAYEGDDCVVRLRDDPSAPLPPAPTIDLLLAMPRPRFLQRILPQIATLGVRRLILTNAERVEPFYFATHLLEPDNLFPLLREGLEQAHDPRVPEVIPLRAHYRRFWIEELAPAYAPGHKILAHPGPVSPPSVIPRDAEPLLLAIGAEGGWTDPEVALFDSLGFTRFSAGDRILRTDTACAGLLALAHYLRQASA